MPSQLPPHTGHTDAPDAASYDAEQRLRELGIETHRTRAMKAVVPWFASIAFHVMLVVVGFLITWSVVLLAEKDKPIEIIADFDAVSYAPLELLPSDDEDVSELLVQDLMVVDAPEVQTTIETPQMPFDLSDLIDEPHPAPSLSDFAPQAPSGSATFLGLSTSNAQDVVYVIDASGSMIRTMQLVLDELERSLTGLTPQQNFALIFFQRNEAVVVPPTDRLHPATPQDKARAIEWARREIIPRGRSNPLAALQKAMSFKPDVIFLLSENITGSGEFEIDQADLLRLLDRLNPEDPEFGLRPTRINCIQFAYPDPLDTLRRIAEQHGDPRGYKFLDEAELGLSGR